MIARALAWLMSAAGARTLGAVVAVAVFGYCSWWWNDNAERHRRDAAKIETLQEIVAKKDAEIAAAEADLKASKAVFERALQDQSRDAALAYDAMAARLKRAGDTADLQRRIDDARASGVGPVDPVVLDVLDQLRCTNGRTCD